MRIEVKSDILGENNRRAARLAEMFRAKGIFVLNIIGSPGAGKTALLEQVFQKLEGSPRIAVIEGDLFTEKDAARLEAMGIRAIQLNTRGGCHLDASMIERAWAELAKDDELPLPELLIIENVGNLVCPAEFNLGEDMKLAVLSVAEGADKPLKYPLIFKEAGAVVFSKTDLLPYVDFDYEGAVRDVTMLRPGAKIFPLSAKTGDGLDSFCRWLRTATAEKKENSRIKDNG